MNRIVTVLGGFGLGFIALAILTGLPLLSSDIRDPADRAAQRNLGVHRLSGVAAGMAVLLVNCVVVTYFIGTSRWCREVSETYKLGEAFNDRSTQLKRRTFPASLAAILTVIGIAALGAAADPMTGTRPPGEGIDWGTLHLLGVVVGLAIMAFTLFVQMTNVRSNHAVIDDVLAQVHRIRSERGLD
ncbi:MAG TPA: hypothetical protein VG713_04065 [Pirellulales bacterium]|nr:hypothetical protein [Pirellulales bacterium]